MKDISKKLYLFQTKMFNFVMILTWILYFIIAFSVSFKAPEYLEILHFYIKIYVSLFLIWRFNPLRRVKVTQLDVRIAFSAGVFLFTTTIIGQLLITYIKQIRQILHNM
jgi:hypothetical protein